MPVARFPTFRQVAVAGSFEGPTTIGLGVRARLPFRVLVLAGSRATRPARAWWWTSPTGGDPPPPAGRSAFGA